MSTKAAARELMYARLVDNYSTTAYTFANEAFTPPVDTSWIRFDVREESSFQQTLGIPTNRKFERGGSIYIDIFTPADKGTSESDVLVDELRTLFEGVTFSGIRCYNVVARELGPSEDGAWFHTNVQVFYDYDQIK
jgi:hypothetical protein